MAGGDVWLGNMNFVERGHYQQLQIELAETVPSHNEHCCSSDLLKASSTATKRKVRSRPALLVQSILIGDGGGENGVGQLGFLSARFA